LSESALAPPLMRTLLDLEHSGGFVRNREVRCLRHLSFVLITVAAAALAGCGKQPQAAAGPAAGMMMMVVPVSVAKVEQQSVPTVLRVVGTVEASAIVQVKSQIAGQIERVAFQEGQNVKKDDLLFVIDRRPYQDALLQAEAAVARDKAQIAQSEATLARDTAQAKFAESDAVRYAQMAKEGVGSKEQFEQFRANADVARESAKATEASIASARAALDADQAAVEAARLNLGYCEIRAPLSGRTGNLLVHAGNLVKVNDVALVVIHQLAPIFVNFSVPEQHLAAIRRLNAAGPLEVRAATRDNPGQYAQGRLAVIDNTVDATTGTIHLKASFPNANAMLWPGQFVNVELTLDTIRDAAVAPSEAVQSGQQGQFVYVVKADNRVEIRPVTTGSASGGSMLIEKGLAPGETVVTDGQMRLFPGAQVRAVDARKVEAERP
jgi:membrane fusion protein, multidrug efflux system